MTGWSGPRLEVCKVPRKGDLEDSGLTVVKRWKMIRRQNCDGWTETAERDKEIRVMMMLSRCQEGD